VCLNLPHAQLLGHDSFRFLDSHIYRKVALADSSMTEPICPRAMSQWNIFRTRPVLKTIPVGPSSPTVPVGRGINM
jgi:hypothetical protein